MNLSRSTLQNLWSLRQGQAPDQRSTRLVLQSCLEHLDGLNRRVHEEIQEIQEIRSLFTDLLRYYQSDVTMGGSGGYDSTISSQAGLDGTNAIPPLVSSHDRRFMPQPAPHRTSFGVMGSLSEGMAPVRAGLLPDGARSPTDYRPTAQPSPTQPQHDMYNEAFSAFLDPCVMESSSEGADPHVGQNVLLDLSLHDASDSVYEPTALPFQGIYYEHVVSNSSARPDERLPRHVKEVHEGKIKVVCPDCGREFKRSYQMNEHILRSRCGGS